MEMDSKYSDAGEANDIINAAVLYLFPKRFGTSLTSQMRLPPQS